MRTLLLGTIIGLLANHALAQMTLRVDATEIERSLIHAVATIPVAGNQIDLYYVESRDRGHHRGTRWS